MKFWKRKGHVIDMIFPIAIFFVFATSSFLVLLLSADIYSSQTAKADENDALCTPLAYVAEKVRQNDTGGVSIQTAEGRDCLALRGESDGIGYVIYIYEYEGTLKELSLREGVYAPLESGTDIMEVDGFTMEEPEEGLFRFSSKDSDGAQATIYVSVRAS